MYARRRHLPPSAHTTTTTITHPLACNCKTGWVSSSFPLRQRTTTSHVGSSSSSASICTHHDNNDNSPPRLQLRDRVGFFFLFFKATNDDETCRLVVVICLSLHAYMPALLVRRTHNDNDKPCRLVVVAPVPGCLACERGALYKYIIN